MKKAVYFKELRNNEVQCTLCPFNCRISDGGVGHCRTRLNQGGELYSLVYGNPTGFQVDPIEKKPFFHFHPGSRVLSFGTQGCNFRCQYCCNYYFSQAMPEKGSVRITPESIVNKAVMNDCEGIAYTYNEPTIFFEYAFDTMKLASKKGLFNVFVTNGAINKEPVMDLGPYLDAVVIDFKGFNQAFYKKYIGAKLSWVKNGLKHYSKIRAHKEVTNLVVPGLNDDLSEVRAFVQFVIGTLGIDTPIHFLKFFPMYKMNEVPETPGSLLKKCYDIAKEEGARFVYLGNTGSEQENTYCPYCNKLLLLRHGSQLIRSRLVNNGCPNCDEKIPIKGWVSEHFNFG